MKHVLFFCLLLGSVPVLAQTAPVTKPDQYCILEVTPAGRGRDRIKLLVGSPELAPPGRQEEAEHLKALAFEADALNYLSAHGWQVVQAIHKLNEHLVYLRRRAL